MTRTRILTATGIGLSCALACGEAPDHRARQLERAVKSGQPTSEENASELAPVFFLEVTQGSGSAVCSASLITPHLLLTAGHCVTGQFQSVDCASTTLDSPLELDSFRVSSEADLSGTPEPSWQFWGVANVELLFPEALLCGNDLALLQLEEAIPGDLALPLPVHSAAPDNLDFRLIGYGAVHPSGTGERVRRVADGLFVECASPDACEGTLVAGVAGAPSAPAPEIVEGEFVGTPAGCPGDSGGPAMHVGLLSAGILGVLSRGTEGCSENVYSRVPFDRLAERVRTLSVELGDPIPAWALEPVDEPDPGPSEGGAGGEPNEGTGGSVPFGGQAREPISRGCSCEIEGAASRQPSPSPLALLPGLVLVWLRRRARRTSRC